MYRVALINMPFASLHLPSLALTQLKAVLDDRFGGRVSTEVLYLNHDFAHYMGLDLYQHISILSQGLWMGEWFFRQAAFPDLADNTEEYFRRFYPRPTGQTLAFKRAIQDKRLGLSDCLDSLIDKYALDQANIVGFTSMFLQNVACLAMARQLKARQPEAITVLGGASGEAPMGDVIVKHVEQIDFVFSGPALQTFAEFVGYCLNGEPDKCHRIAGVFSKRNRVAWPPEATPGQPVNSSDNLYVSPIGPDPDINTRIVPDYGPFLDLHDKNWGGKVEKVLLFETSRGCWWGERSQCTFCGFNGGNIHYRAMSPAKAIEQFESLFKYAARCSYFWSVDNIMPQDYPQQVFAHLDSPAEVVLGYELRPNLDEADVQSLAKAGVKSLQPGIESLDTATLKRMRKGTNAFQNVLFLKYCVMYDIALWWNLLIGFPGEDEHAAEETYRKYVRDIPSLLHLPPPAEVYPIRFDRYSHYFCNAEQYGLDLRPFDFYALTYPFGEKALASLAYWFEDNRASSARYLTTAIKWIGKIREKLDAWWDRWHGYDPALPPQLFFKSGWVYDSRSGQVVEHHVGEVGRQALEHLSQPRTAADLAQALGHLPGFDPEREIACLQERGLVFQEGERYLSLVLPREPPPPARFSQGSAQVRLLSTIYPNALFKRSRPTKKTAGPQAVAPALDSTR